MTPCDCGWDYRKMSMKARVEQASVVLGMDKKLLEDLIRCSMPEDHPMKHKEWNK